MKGSNEPRMRECDYEDIDPDVAAFGEYMGGLAEAIRDAGRDIREGLEAVATALGDQQGLDNIATALEVRRRR